MPIYEYKCRKCSHEFEMIQRFSDQPVKKCPVCSGHVDKLVSHSAFHLKGTGWYATDYGKKSGSAKSGNKKSEDKAGDDKKEASDKDKDKVKD